MSKPEQPTRLTFSSSDGELNVEAYIKAAMDFHMADVPDDWEPWPSSEEIPDWMLQL